MEKIWVKAKPGIPCPMEGLGQITEVPVEVPNTAHYRRLIREGSLIRLSDEDAKKAAKASDEAEKNAAAARKKSAQKAAEDAKNTKASVAEQGGKAGSPAQDNKPEGKEG